VDILRPLRRFAAAQRARWARVRAEKSAAKKK
jgi:hypothetical protein